MPQENEQNETTSKTSHEIKYFIAGEDGQVFENKEKMPLETLLNFDQFKGVEKLLRFAFDPNSSVIYIQDGREWHKLLDEGDDDAWQVFNHALRHVRNVFKTQPKMKFGEPPNSFKKRKLSQFPVAWEAITNYIKKEFGTDPKDILVVEYVPDKQNADRVKFMPDGGKVGNEEINEPAIFINLNIGMYSQPDYERVNHLLTHEYLKNYGKIDPESFNKHHDGDDELYFAIWKDGTRLFKANREQQLRMYDEDSLRQEKAFVGYKGPIIMISYQPETKQLVVHNGYKDNLEKYERTREMLEDIKRRLGKKKGFSESTVVVIDDDTSTKPTLTKLSKFDVLWDLLNDFFAPEAGFTPQDIPVLMAPLSTDGKIKSLLVKNISDEESIPIAHQMRIKNGVQIQYPFIAVDSRIQSAGMLCHLILREYANFQPALQNLAMLEYIFSEDYDDNAKFLEHATDKEASRQNVDAMDYMLRMGMPSKWILDFFSPRKNLIQRAVYMNALELAMKNYDDEHIKRSPLPPMSRQASIDTGINDWYFYGLQESLNETQHTNNLQSEPAGGQAEVKPFNLRNKNPQLQFSQGPKNTEGLLHKQHDNQFNYMKTMEQLLRESRT